MHKLRIFLNKYWLVTPFAILSVGLLTYYKVPFIFFQQDEWYGFGNMISLGEKLILYRFEGGDVNHFVPLNNLINFLIFQYFALNYFIYNILGLVFHLVNSALVFKIGQKLFQDKSLAIFCALLFISFSSASELVMWPMVGLSTFSLTLSLIAIYLVLKFKVERWVISLVVALLLTIGLLMIEYGAGMILFVPLSLVILAGKKNLGKVVLYTLPIIVFTTVYAYVRFSPGLVSSDIASEGGSIAPSLLERIVTLPFNYIGQLFITEQIANFIGVLTNPQPLFEREKLIFAINLLIGFIVLCGVILLVARIWKIYNSIAKNLIFATIFLITSALPFAFNPASQGVNNNLLLIPSRYFYFGLVGEAIFLVSLLQLILKSKSVKIRYVGLSVLLGLFIVGIIGNWYRQNDLYQKGEIRKKILEQIKKEHPSLPEKVIFYTNSSESYYGLPPETKILPFQSGLGQTLLVWYYFSEKFPKVFYTNRFLWQIDSQAYQESEGRGFGYFRSLSLLKKAIKEYNIPSESIIAYSWEGEEQLLIDISDQIRKDIQY